MKTAIYIEQGVTQLVLTPETDWEKAIVNSIEQGNGQVNITRGGFYSNIAYWRQSEGQESLIIVTTIGTKDDRGVETGVVQ